MKRMYVVALALVLAGCGGDPPPAAPPPPSTSPTSTTPAAPDMPEGAKEDSKEGAKAFVKYYVTLVNHAQATGDTRPLATAEGKGCRSCSQASRGVERLYRDGGHLEGGDWRIRITSTTQSSVFNGWNVGAEVTYPRQVVDFGNGRPDKLNRAGRMTLRLFVELKSDAWRVNEWLRVG